MQAAGAVLIEVNSGRILYGENPDERLYPASTTKIMTALMALEYADPDEIVTVGEEVLYVGWNSSSAGLQVGERISVGDLIYAMLLPSGNDAAYTTAVYLARLAKGNPELPPREALKHFNTLMNMRARELGAFNTNFENPDGYHHPGHYSTASDLALIARAAMQHELLRWAANTPTYTAKLTYNGSTIEKTWFNTNLLLHKDNPAYYPGATGLKTGTTPEAGANLIASADNGTLSLIAVILGSTQEARWNDTAALLNYGFDHFQYHRVVAAGEVLTAVDLFGQADREGDPLQVIAAAGFADVFLKEDVSHIQVALTYDDELMEPKGRGILAPLTEGQSLGTAIFSLNGQTLFETELLAGRSVEARFPYERGALPVAAALLCAITIQAYRRRRRKGFSSK